jgi:hypothetical protein
LRKIKAGAYDFDISINGLGLADATGVSQITISPKITSLSATTGGNKGGVPVTIFGESFSDSDDDTIEVKFGTSEPAVIL